MRRPEQLAPLGLSLVDRLLDTDRPTVAAFRDGLRRDLEELLNTDRRVIGWAADLTELDTSLVNFGVMCLSTVNLSTEQRRAQVVEEIGDIIRQWEPRLANMRVSAVPNVDSSDRSLRMRIEAEILIEPSPEPMIFDTLIDPLGNTVSLTSARSD
ncbi:type VI secretion system baseplate subunit TssE [Roseixanthobacter glucoisosaccharinicivorans]|uniref:type VI secretion system baseplate subunit TssE n=1 Tax=Roseixanthobacter glucoisosaccharinicivorans TaxID=3119923 RepID=UPI00372BE6BE